MFEKNLQIPCLLDIYGALLTDRKRELLEYYYAEDYSLSEISELTGISRQGIRDSIKKSESELISFEKALGLYGKRLRTTEHLKNIRKILSERSDSDLSERLASELLQIEELVL